MNKLLETVVRALTSPLPVTSFSPSMPSSKRVALIQARYAAIAKEPWFSETEFDFQLGMVK
jgi:hypothetical protein